MKLETKKMHRWIAALALAVLVPVAHANLVTDGGLEDWDDSVTPTVFNQWTMGGGASVEFGVVRTGDSSALFQYDSATNSISQNIDLVAGSYNYEFWLNVLAPPDLPSLGDNPFTFTAKLGGKSLIGSPLPDLTQGWTKFLGTVDVAAADLDINGQMLLEFSWAGACDSGAIGTTGAFITDCSIYLDDVSLTAARQGVPEPGTLALVGLALAGIGIARRRKS